MGRFQRICRECEEKFIPDGKYQKICKDCLTIRKRDGFEKRKLGGTPIWKLL